MLAGALSVRTVVCEPNVIVVTIIESMEAVGPCLCAVEVPSDVTDTFSVSVNTVDPKVTVVRLPLDDTEDVSTVRTCSNQHNRNEGADERETHLQKSSWWTNLWSQRCW